MSKILKTRPLVDPALAEFVYTISMTASMAQKRHLPEKFFNVIKTERAAKKFSRTASTDQKKEFLEYMGYSSFFIISNVDNVWSKTCRDVLDKYEHPKGKIDWQRVIKEGVLVTSDKELVRIFSLLSSATASKLYRLEQELFRAKSATQKWSNKLELEEHSKIEKQELSTKDFLRYGDVFMEQFIMCDNFLEIGPEELLILFLLYQNKSTFVPHLQIKDHSKWLIPANKITSVECKLLEQIMIRQGFDYRKKEFMITSRGIRTVNQFRERVLKNFNFSA